MSESYMCSGWNKFASLALCESIPTPLANGDPSEWEVDTRGIESEDELVELVEDGEFVGGRILTSTSWRHFGPKYPDVDVLDVDIREMRDSDDHIVNSAAKNLEKGIWSMWALSTALEKDALNIVGASDDVTVTEVRKGEASRGELVQVTGEVASASEITQVSQKVTVECGECGMAHVESQDIVDTRVRKPNYCDACETAADFHIERRDDSIPRQTIIVEELMDDSDGSDPSDCVVTLIGAQAGMVEAGERVDITGYVHAEFEDEGRQETLISEGQLVAVGVDDATSKVNLDMDDEEKEDIRETVDEDGFYDRVVDSFGPTLEGMDAAKRGVIASLLTGGDIQMGEEHIRGDSHLALIGDPGNGKSKLLEWANDIAPKGGITSADNSTGKGLTASVVEDKRLPQPQTLRAGHLPRSHGGVACIDELDKGENTDELYTPLARGVVERAVWGQVRKMPAKCRVLAAANPVDSTFDPNAEIVDQFDFDGAMLSRFDLVYAIQSKSMTELGDDIADSMANSILKSQNATATDGGEVESDLLSKEWMTKWMHLAWQIDPEYTRESLETIKKDWKDTIHKQDDVATRALQGLFRLARGMARLRLDDTVTPLDARRASEIWRESLETYATNDLGEIDQSVMSRGISSEESDRREAIINAVAAVEDEKNRGATLDDLYEAVEGDQKDIAASVSALMNDERLYEPASEGSLRAAN